MSYKKETWNSIRISNCCSFVRGVTYSKDDEVDSNGHGILRANNISIDNKINFDDIKIISQNVAISAEKRLLKDDILFCQYSGSVEHVGKVGFIKTDTDYFAGGFMGILRPAHDNINAYYFYNVLISSLFDDIKKMQRAGTNIQSLKFSDFDNYEIPLPPLEEQKQIADLFQSIETAMEKVDGQEKNLKALQKSLVNGLLSKEPVFGNLLSSKNCTATTFGEIAECDKKYPEHEKEVERFVGLEFIEADNFQLQGWGEIANGTTFTKRFVKGDVLFGKRRAYLKKVAVADFDGICSGDILVIRAKAKKMLQGLLPYYISSDTFIQHAVSTSAGSLSPRTKWKDLADLEVSIPDPNTQSTILEVLQQLDKTVNQLKQQKTTLKNLKKKLLNDILG